MSLTVVFRETALRGLARLRSEDKELFTGARHAIARLPDQSRPENAVAWGATAVYRLHSGNIRILYEVDEDAAIIYIINVAAISWSHVAGPPCLPPGAGIHVRAVVGRPPGRRTGSTGRPLRACPRGPREQLAGARGRGWLADDGGPEAGRGEGIGPGRAAGPAPELLIDCAGQDSR
jgi:mRNA-degrading endonuclease RelE of RelBE toxin-antitoxin system